jgi:MYXO-CTERM domain-containing protein
MKSSIACALVLAATFSSISTAANAYEVKTTRNNVNVHWKDRFVMYKLNEAGSSDMSLTETRTALLRSFNSWNHPSSQLRLVYGGETPEAEIGYDRNLENTNLVVWEEEHWEFDESVLAVTLTTFNTQNGALLDADIVVNGVHYQWGANGSQQKHDLSNSLTHEVGHLIGLDHSESPDATMYASAPIGETKKRDLSDDDIRGLNFMYGEGTDTITEGSGDIEVVDEYGVRLNDAQFHLSCSSAPSGHSGRPGALFAFAALLFGALFWRRRRVALALSVVVVSMVAGVGVASATTLTEFSLEDLTTRSDSIVLAEVVKSEAAFEGGIIWTTTTLRVEACPTGLSCVEGQELQMRTPGGVVADLGQAISGVRSVEVGQRAVFFLERQSQLSAVFRPMGMAQGVMVVHEVGDSMMAHRDLRGLNLRRQDKSVVHGDELTYAIPLTELFEEISALRP